MKRITSRQNALVREFRHLSDAESGDTRILLDGAHQVRDAQQAGAVITTVAVNSTSLDADTEEAALARALEAAGIDVYAVTTPVLAAMSPVRTPSGIVAIAQRQPVPASSVCSIVNGLTVAAIDVQDPGNLGSLIRAAEAGGATGVLTCGTSANPFSWKALRGSMGSALRLPVARGPDADSVMACARSFGARTIASVPRGGREPDAVDWTGKVVLLIGGEGAGLDDAVAAQCDERVTIPMAPSVESLNVAVAGALLVYAARRQRS